MMGLSRIAQSFALEHDVLSMTRGSVAEPYQAVFVAPGAGGILGQVGSGGGATVPDAVNSTCVASPGSSIPPLVSYTDILPADWIVRDGVAFTTITVTVRDSGNLPIAGSIVTLAVSGTFAPVTVLNISAASGPSDVNGEVTFTVSADKDSFSGAPNTWYYANENSGVEFTATADGVAITQPAVAIFARLVVTMVSGTGQSVYDSAVAQYNQATVENNALAIWEIYIPAGVTCTNLSMGGPWAAGAAFLIHNAGNLYGLGGDGGNGGSGTGENGFAGSDGGTALSLGGLTVDIENDDGVTPGFIFGGGGGAGGGAAGTNGYGGGGGGGGAKGGIGGTGGAGTSSPGLNGQDSPAIDTTGGTGGGTFFDLEGGAGGTLGVVGTVGDSTGGLPGSGGGGGGTGANGGAGGLTNLAPGFLGGAGGSVGLAVDLGGGTVDNINGNDAAHLKGAIA